LFCREREFFIDNLLVRIHFIIVMIRWTGLAPWEFEFPFPGSLTSFYFAGTRWTMSTRARASLTPALWSPPLAIPPQGEQLLYRSVKRFRGGLIFKAHRLMYLSTLGWRVITKKTRGRASSTPALWSPPLAIPPQGEQLLYRSVKRFRGGLIFKAHRLMYLSTLGWRVITKKTRGRASSTPALWSPSLAIPPQGGIT